MTRCSTPLGGGILRASLRPRPTAPSRLGRAMLKASARGQALLAPPARLIVLLQDLRREVGAGTGAVPPGACAGHRPTPSASRGCDHVASKRFEIRRDGRESGMMKTWGRGRIRSSSWLRKIFFPSLMVSDYTPLLQLGRGWDLSAGRCPHFQMLMPALGRPKPIKPTRPPPGRGRSWPMPSTCTRWHCSRTCTDFATQVL